MINPYQVLGVPQNASMDEIKKAYRKLSRIYHPDANINNPNKAQAEAKFKEIQAAYRQIVDEKEHGGSGSYSNYDGDRQNNSGYGGYGNQDGYGGFGGFGGFSGFGGFGGYTERRQQSTESTLMQAAGNYIRSRHFKEAYNVLQNVPMDERNAKWYYYSAMANSGTGNNITGLEHAKMAVQLEPNNMEYAQLLRQMESGEAWYTDRGQGYGRTAMGVGSCCLEYAVMQCLCSGCCC